MTILILTQILVPLILIGWLADEPHLHIHAQRPGTLAMPLSGDPLPVRFNGRFLIRSDRLTTPTSRD